MYRNERPAAHPITGTATVFRPNRRGTTARARTVSALAVLTLGFAGLGLTACGQSQAAGANGFETVSYSGDNPFTEPVGTDDPDITPVDNAGGEHGGDTKGLYAQDPAAPPCDAKALVAQLQKDEAKARAWADVLGLDVNKIPDFVGGLTPVVLRSATAVTNYSYVDGTYRAAPAVLAPGTAVFVNLYGAPTVKCYSGNPLTRGTSTDPAVTVITPSPRVLTRTVFVNPRTGAQVPKENRPTKAQLEAAAQSAMKQAKLLASGATTARSNADVAKKASMAADADLTTKSAAFDALDKQRMSLESDLAKLLQDPNAKPEDIQALRNKLDILRPSLEKAGMDRDAAKAEAEKRKTEAERLEAIAKQAAADAKAAAEAARRAAMAAGLPPGPEDGKKQGEVAPDQAVQPVDGEQGQGEPVDGAPAEAGQGEPGQGGEGQGGDGQAGQGGEGQAGPDGQAGQGGEVQGGQVQGGEGQNGQGG